MVNSSFGAIHKQLSGIFLAEITVFTGWRYASVSSKESDMLAPLERYLLERGESVTTQTRSQKHWGVVASTAHRPLLIITAFLLLLLIGTLVANRATLAGNTVGSFEIDGNLIVDHLVPPAEPIDWDSSPFPAALTTFTDGTGSTDNIFGLGTKENDQSTWVCTTGSAPPKDDLVNEISLNGAPPIAGQIALRFFPGSSSSTPTGRAYQTTATPISITSSTKRTPRLILPVPAARNCRDVRPATS